MKTVIAGTTLAHTPKREHIRRKGYSANRVTYDRRRRLSTRSEATRAYMRILAADVCSFCGAHPDDSRRGVSDRDHIVPLSAKGLDTWENLTAACAPCNRGRRDRDVLTFMARRRDA